MHEAAEDLRILGRGLEFEMIDVSCHRVTASPNTPLNEDGRVNLEQKKVCSCDSCSS
jgi:hypothetical protein